jgi:hypothetical protein
MRTISAEEWEVLSFFEVEPSVLDKGIAWPYNDFAYEVNQGDISLSCAIAPAYRDVRLILKHNGQKIYELNSVGVDDVKYKKEGDDEILEIIISPLDTIRLKIKPCIEINHKTNET